MLSFSELRKYVTKNPTVVVLGGIIFAIGVSILIEQMEQKGQMEQMREMKQKEGFNLRKRKVTIKTFGGHSHGNSQSDFSLRSKFSNLNSDIYKPANTYTGLPNEGRLDVREIS